jgi:hypothetical protein
VDDINSSRISLFFHGHKCSIRKVDWKGLRVEDFVFDFRFILIGKELDLRLLFGERPMRTDYTIILFCCFNIKECYV